MEFKNGCAAIFRGCTFHGSFLGKIHDERHPNWLRLTKLIESILEKVFEYISRNFRVSKVYI